MRDTPARRILRTLVLVGSIARSESALATERPRLPVFWTFASSEGCPGAEEFVALLEGRAPELDLLQTDQQPMLKVRLTRRGDEALAQAELSHDGLPPELRQFKGSSCPQVAEALAVMLAIALPASSHDAQKEPALPPAPPPERVPPPPSERSAAAGLGVSAAFEAEKPLTNTWLTGVRFGLGWRRPGASWSPTWRFSLSHAANWFDPSEQPRFSLSSAGFAFCPLSRERLVSTELCASARLGWLAARGGAIDYPLSSHSFYTDWGGDARASVALGGPFRAAFLGSLRVTPITKRFVYLRPEQALAETNRLFGLLALGLGGVW